MTERIANRSNFGPVLKNLPKVFKGLGLVLLRDVDGVGASDVDVVGCMVSDMAETLICSIDLVMSWMSSSCCSAIGMKQMIG